MAESKYVPRNAIVVDRYEELNNFTRAFATGHLRFLMVVGPAGTGKVSCQVLALLALRRGTFRGN